ncbi:hypothetical protein JCGZ_03706 [Jatropha curcas]|uniref:Uncharacterized protein n=1 Tax=Jatropha curcas TaxID=180498 RepID=A0A067L5N7_JATCU|nr:hypothetical protein JCGZ_03706 [Jatropha curcas]
MGGNGENSNFEAKRASFPDCKQSDRRSLRNEKKLESLSAVAVAALNGGCPLDVARIAELVPEYFSEVRNSRKSLRNEKSAEPPAPAARPPGAPKQSDFAYKSSLRAFCFPHSVCVDGRSFSLTLLTILYCFLAF